jgi:secreted PhoX family phosphatase
LRLIATSISQEQLDYPDNLTLSPWGDIYTTEDGDGQDYVRVIKPDGNILPFARNAAGDGELTGICFAPDGSTLFLNIQGLGLTLAVRGPFLRF